MDIEQITDAGSLAALQPEWDQLWERCPAATPFQTPEWLTTWWELFGEGRLSTLAMRAGRSLVGLLPAFVDGAGVLRLVGDGISDYLDLLAEPEIADNTARAVLLHLARRCDWECGEFVDLRPDSPLLAAGAVGGIQARAEPSIVCPFLECPRSAAEFMAGLPHGLARNLRRYGERLASTCDVRIEQADEASLGEHLDALFLLHSQRWALKQGSGGVLSDDQVQNFHRRVSPALLGRGRLRLYGLRCDGRLRAVQYGFAAHQAAYFYLGGFDPALARFSPGALLIAHAIREGIQEGLRRVDFLRGDEAYKYGWGSRDRTNQRLHLRRAMAGAGDV